MRSTTGTFPWTPDVIRSVVRDALPSATAMEGRGGGGGDAVISIGAFDGVHRGHRQLIEACMRTAREWGARSVVVTFDPDPSELLEGRQLSSRLLAVRDRIALCRSLGVDEVFVVPFTPELASLSPRAFVGFLQERLGSIRCVHVGENFRFGHRGKGTVQTLSLIGSEMGFEVRVQPLYRMGDEVVSSTRIRKILSEGRVGDVEELLGRYHFVRGVVVHGRGKGTTFGFPTANVVCDPQECVPSEGVYACVVTDGARAWPAAVNVGMPPTFTKEHDGAFLEANLLGFSGDLYGSELSVLFIAWLRASRPFSSLEELERVVLGNIAWVRDNIGATEVVVSP